MDFLSRALPLYPDGGIKRLAAAHVCVFGLGGVGSALTEALVRAGVGRLTLVDGDVYSLSNKNRQLYATDLTLGQNKAEAACVRARSINPVIRAEAVARFYVPGEEFPLSGFDYLCDCIDDVPAKLDLVCRAKEENVPLLCAMGAGGKLDPTRFRVTDLAKTHTCPLAKKMRVELRKRGIIHQDVAFSDEPPRAVTTPPSSVSFVPPVLGFVMAAHVITQLMNPQI